MNSFSNYRNRNTWNSFKWAVVLKIDKKYQISLKASEIVYQYDSKEDVIYLDIFIEYYGKYIEGEKLLNIATEDVLKKLLKKGQEEYATFLASITSSIKEQLSLKVYEQRFIHYWIRIPLKPIRKAKLDIMKFLDIISVFTLKLETSIENFAINNKRVKQ